MRKRTSGKYLVAAFLAVATLFVIAENLLVHKFQECVAANTADSSHKASDNKTKIIVVLSIAKAQAICSVRVLDKHNGLFSALAGVAVAFFTFTLWKSTKGLWDTSIKQSKDMRDSISEAARAASAMEQVSGHLKINAEQIVESVKISKSIADTQREFGMMQLRAYLSVTGNGASFQERGNDIAFEGRCAIINNGQTPAHKLTYWACSDILSVPLPDDFSFPPPESTVQYSALLGAHNGLEINAMLVRPGPQDWVHPNKLFVNDSEVADIKSGKTRALYTWGVVTYEDMFGISHETKFCFWFVWFRGPNGEIIKNFFSGRHNEGS